MYVCIYEEMYIFVCIYILYTHTYIYEERGRAITETWNIFRMFIVFGLIYAWLLCILEAVNFHIKCSYFQFHCVLSTGETLICEPWARSELCIIFFKALSVMHNQWALAAIITQLFRKTAPKGRNIRRIASRKVIKSKKNDQRELEAVFLNHVHSNIKAQLTSVCSAEYNSYFKPNSRNKILELHEDIWHHLALVYLTSFNPCIIVTALFNSYLFEIKCYVAPDGGAHVRSGLWNSTTPSPPTFLLPDFSPKICSFNPP